MFLFLFGSSWAPAQSLPQKQKIWVGADTLQLDSLPLIRGSVSIIGFQEDLNYGVQYSSGKIYWMDGQRPDTLFVTFRSLSLNLEITVRHKDPAIKDNLFREGTPAYTPSKSINSELPKDGLSTLGNLSRGIGFGNQQDVVVNSNLNLRISGKLANDVEVLAAISDENNPIQPEGNTQQLQDFDKVFIKLTKKKSSIVLGDFEMKSQEPGYFMKFYKKSRGLQFGHEQAFGKSTYNVNAELALARGRFSRNVMDGLEGNRGPYRLKGTNGEIFIIIIAGTEVIYLDGEKLNRGEQNDYVIDYNSGELTFMPRVVITRYSRIVAEFQYSDRNYARTVAHANNNWQRKKAHIFLNIYNEADNKNKPFQQSLDGYDSISGFSAREVLANAGDVTQATMPKVKAYGGLLSDRILYLRKNHIIYGVYYEQALSAEEDSVFFEVTFSYLGSGKGNYRQKQSGANGRVYKWVEPVGGIPQGDYDPVDILIPARSLSMFNAGVAYTFSEKLRVTSELAFSHQDLNTFSTKDSRDDNGLGLKLGWEGKTKQDSIRYWNYSHKGSFEWVDSRFRYVERYRDVEFDRRWNRTLQNPDADNARKFGEEKIGDLWLGAFYKKKAGLKYRLSLYEMKNVTDGMYHNLEVFYRGKHIEFTMSPEFLKSRRDTSENAYFRMDPGISFPFGTWKPGAYSRLEQSVFNNQGGDRLNGSYSFLQKGFFIGKTGKKGLNFLLDANQRDDKQIRDGGLKPFTKATTASFNGNWNPNDQAAFALTTTIRNLEFQDSVLKPENTLQVRLDALFSLFNKGIVWQSYWQAGTAQEQRREFSYLQVQPGNGVYVWNDYDSNGLQTLNEFETASELDRNRASYIRVFIPVQGFIQTVSGQFNQTIKLEPGRFMKQVKGKKPHWLNRFSSVNALNLDRKTRETLSAKSLNPFDKSLEDTSVISTTGSLRSTWFFNRADPVYGFDYNRLSFSNKLLLVNGFEWRQRRENQFRARWNVSRAFTLQNETKWGDRLYTSQYFGSRSYDYHFWQTEPKIQYQYDNRLRLTLFYKTMKARNKKALGGEKMQYDEAGIEGKWLSAEKGVLSAAMSMVKISYNASPGTTLAYDLLQGLLPGNNLKWNLSGERRLGEKVQLSVQYDGRKSPLTKPIHIGRVVARYIF